MAASTRRMGARGRAGMMAGGSWCIESGNSFHFRIFIYFTNIYFNLDGYHHHSGTKTRPPHLNIYTCDHRVSGHCHPLVLDTIERIPDDDFVGSFESSPDTFACRKELYRIDCCESTMDLTDLSIYCAFKIYGYFNSRSTPAQRSFSRQTKKNMWFLDSDPNLKFHCNSRASFKWGST